MHNQIYSASDTYYAVKSLPTAMGKRLWNPTLEQLKNAIVVNFAAFVKAKHGFDWRGDFQALYGDGQSLKYQLFGNLRELAWHCW